MRGDRLRAGFLRDLVKAGIGGHAVAPLAGRLAGVGLWGRGGAPGPAVRLPRALPASSRPERLAPSAGSLPAAAGGG